MELILAVAGLLIGLILIVGGYQLAWEMLIEEWLKEKGLDRKLIRKLETLSFVLLAISVYGFAKAFLIEEMGYVAIGILSSLYWSKNRRERLAETKKFSSSF